jgi:hypothetical protein
VKSLAAVNLRLDRAGEHFVELNRLITAYDLSKPYTVSDGIEGKDQEYVYRLKFTSEPDPRIAVIAGDYLHNVRSALNYLMRGLVSSRAKDSTQFPIFTTDPFARDPITRKYIDRKPDSRRTWDRYVQGADPRALAYIQSIQPYAAGPRAGKIHYLSAVNWLSNTDKHRELVVTPQGLQDPGRIVWRPDGTAVSYWWQGVVKDGTEVFRSPTPVNVELDGPTLTLLRVRGRDGGEMLITSLSDTLVYVRGMIVDILAPYLRR